MRDVLGAARSSGAFRDSESIPLRSCSNERKKMADSTNVKWQSGGDGDSTSISTDNNGEVGYGTIIEDEEARQFMLKTSSSYDSDDGGSTLSPSSSSIEFIADRVQSRRERRIVVTSAVRGAFLDECHGKAMESGEGSNKITVSDLRVLCRRCSDRGRYRHYRNRWWHRLFFRNFDMHEMLLRMYDRALTTALEDGDECFYYRDFAFYSTRVVSRWHVRRSEIIWSLFLIISFYGSTALFFCVIWPSSDPRICPADPTGLDRKMHGILTSLYFASSTMSTVGYGDISLNVLTSNLHGVVAITYMIIALVIGYTVFAESAETVLIGVSETTFRRNLARIIDACVPSRWLQAEDSSFHNYRLWRMGVLRTFEIIVYFLACNMVGTILARTCFLDQTRAASNDFKGDYEKWTWVTTFYWAVQTTTTIGYGDLDSSYETLSMRTFKIFYCTLGSFLVGGAFGALAGLRQELSDCSRYFAWKQREVSKRLILDMKGPGQDFQINEYEFFVGSLLALGKVDQNDVRQIMDKFRSLAGEKSYIAYQDTEEESNRIGLNERRDVGRMSHYRMDIDRRSTRF